MLRKLKSTFFSLLPAQPKRPKQKNSCSKMWPIDQMYIELGRKLLLIVGTFFAVSYRRLYLIDSTSLLGLLKEFGGLNLQKKLYLWLHLMPSVVCLIFLNVNFGFGLMLRRRLRSYTDQLAIATIRCQNNGPSLISSCLPR